MNSRGGAPFNFSCLKVLAFDRVNLRDPPTEENIEADHMPKSPDILRNFQNLATNGDTSKAREKIYSANTSKGMEISAVSKAREVKVMEQASQNEGKLEWAHDDAAGLEPFNLMPNLAKGVT